MGDLKTLALVLQTLSLYDLHLPAFGKRLIPLGGDIRVHNALITRNIREWTDVASVEDLFCVTQDRDAFEELTANLRQ